MLENLTKFAQTTKKKKAYRKTIELLEPHVTYFETDETNQSRFTLPFHLMTATLGIMLCLAFYFWLTVEDYMMIRVCIWMQLIFAPMYVPGLYFYAMYYERDRYTELEVDSKNELIKYRGQEQHLLFHKSQVERCEIHLSMLFPYQLDYLTLHLKGGQQVHVSSLVIDPKWMVRWFESQPTVTRAWFNVMPASRVRA